MDTQDNQENNTSVVKAELTEASRKENDYKWNHGYRSQSNADKRFL